MVRKTYTKKRKTRRQRNKKINLEKCPKCGKSMREHINMCPYCANPILKDIEKCPYCKMYIHGTMKGGSGCGAFGCPIAPLSVSNMKQIGGNEVMGKGPILGIGQNGGTSICSTKNILSGGGMMPGPFVGSPWNGRIINWPGVNGIGSDKNYLEYNSYSPIDISRQMKLNDTQVGGKKKTRRKKQYKGGSSLFMNDLVNLGQDLTYNFKSVYNTLNGYPAPIDPTPYKGHFKHMNNF
jgi:hypothetical protein